MLIADLDAAKAQQVAQDLGPAARAVGCDEWLIEAKAARRSRDTKPEKPAAPGPEGVDYWKKYFGL